VILVINKGKTKLYGSRIAANPLPMKQEDTNWKELIVLPVLVH
jgi:hypothetical protein